MKFTIVIPAYNSSRMLQRCLESIRKIDYPEFETIVVDDGSTDDTADRVKHYPDVKYIKQKNQGPAAARNRGAQEASGTLVFFTDADCIVPPDILARYAPCFSEGSIAGMGGGYRTFNADNPVARYIGREIEFRHQYAGAGKTTAFGTYNAVFDRQVFLEAGGFDTSFQYASGEDFDFCYRLVKSGYKLAFDPDIFVYHEHPDSIGKYLKQQYKRGTTRTKNLFRHKKNAISDSYVEKSVKWQPPLLAGIFLGIGLLFFWPAMGLGLLAFFTGLLLASNRRFYRFMAQNDPRLLPLAILLSFLKPITWSLGIINYLGRRISATSS